MYKSGLLIHLQLEKYGSSGHVKVWSPSQTAKQSAPILALLRHCPGAAETPGTPFLVKDFAWSINMWHVMLQAYNGHMEALHVLLQAYNGHNEALHVLLGYMMNLDVKDVNGLFTSFYPLVFFSCSGWLFLFVSQTIYEDLYGQVAHKNEWFTQKNVSCYQVLFSVGLVWPKCNCILLIPCTLSHTVLDNYYIVFTGTQDVPLSIFMQWFSMKMGVRWKTQMSSVFCESV